MTANAILTPSDRIEAVKKIVAQTAEYYGVVIVPTIEQMPNGTLLTDTMQIRYLAQNGWTPPQVEPVGKTDPSRVTVEDATVAAVDSATLERMANGAHEPGKFEE